MKIQLISDLHMEMWSPNIEPKLLNMMQTDADVLVIAGDLDSGRTNTIRSLKKFADRYPKVVYVTGNHEFYNGSDLNAFRVHQSFAAKLPDNVVFLDNGITTIDGVKFVGGPLYTDFHQDPVAIQQSLACINDFHRIKDATPERYIKEQNHTVDIINMFGMEDAVIVTHFIPAIELVHPKWGDTPLNKYFANNLGNMIARQRNCTWFFGHTHDSVDQMIGQTRCLCNPFGYAMREENDNFNYGLVIDIP
jgi:predicted phosphodiesterase